MLLIFLSYAGAADDAARHKEWMDAAQDLKDDLKDALDAKSSGKAMEPADKLAQIGAREEEYWKKAKLDDAVKLAQQNRAASRAIAAAVREGRWDRALQAYGTLEAACRACHDLHPEKRLPARP